MGQKYPKIYPKTNSRVCKVSTDLLGIGILFWFLPGGQEIPQNRSELICKGAVKYGAKLFLFLIISFF